MRLDHIVIHVDNDAQKLRALSEEINAFGYPFDPDKGKHSAEINATTLNIGDEYLEILRLLRRNAHSWMPVWSKSYDEGKRGVFCIFLEVEDVERTAVALKKAGIRARGPAVLTYPAVLGLVRVESPYFIYYLPEFPDSTLQLALMQYKKPENREAALASLVPNSQQLGINGIRRLEIELPNLDESIDLLQKVFVDLRQENGEWSGQLNRIRIVFRRSADAATHLRATTITSQRNYVGKKFQIENLEVVTAGG